MGIVIRTLYNNQAWKQPCVKPFADHFCFECLKDYVSLSIKPPSKDDEVCSGRCWEQNICSGYRWGCTPSGRRFGKRAFPGMKAYFVYKQPDGKYTIWGTSVVRSIESVFKKSSIDDKEYQFMNLQPFDQLPQRNWARNMTDKQLVGEEWRQGRYRFIDSEQESYLDQLIKNADSIPGQLTSPKTLELGKGQYTLAPSIEKKLDSIAIQEGRAKDDLVKEAIAEWLNKRESESA